MNPIIFLFKALRKSFYEAYAYASTPIAAMFFYLNGVSVGKNLKVKGPIKLFVTRRGKLRIGSNFRVNSGGNFNLIGRQQKCIFWVDGKLEIGSNVGISSCAIICINEISIGNNVVIGGNTVIYDTDFHSLDASHRVNSQDDIKNRKSAAVKIHDNVFVGAHSTILKGVEIGSGSIVGACSVVTKSIPAAEIWAGNPAKFIKKI